MADRDEAISSWRLCLLRAWAAFVVGGIWWGLARIPTWITLADDVLTFQTVLRRFEIPNHTVVSVKALWSDPFGTMPVLKHTGGKVTLISAMDGFHEFLTRLKDLNPTIEVRGM